MIWATVTIINLMIIIIDYNNYVLSFCYVKCPSRENCKANKTILMI